MKDNGMMLDNGAILCDWLKDRQKFTLTEFEEHIKHCNKCKSIRCIIGRFCDDEHHDDTDDESI
jgi:hypothetical protein